MYLTEQEILDTPSALKKTSDYFYSMQNTIESFLSINSKHSFVFFGCGSSYMLSKGAATLFNQLENTSSFAIAAGDFLVNPDDWKHTIQNSIIVCLSRSGRTSEMVRSMKIIKERWNLPIVSFSMRKDNDITPFSNLDLIMDWCYDDSVCQTRTVTNLYAAVLYFAAFYAKDKALLQGIDHAVSHNLAFREANVTTTKEMACLDWNRVIVLADGPVCGIAEEGALAFTEISMLSGTYFHMLDYRHGPVVISGQKTLTVILVRPGDKALQAALVKDIISRGGPVLTVSCEEGNPYGATAHVTVSKVEPYVCWGISFIFLCQMMALNKCLSLGCNPDAPSGLDAYITL